MSKYLKSKLNVNGKGDKPRKYSKKKYDSNYDLIKWRSKLEIEKECDLKKKSI